MHNYPKSSETQRTFHTSLSDGQEFWFIVVSHTQWHAYGSRPGSQPSAMTTHHSFIT